MWTFFRKKFFERNNCTWHCSAIAKTVDIIGKYFNLMAGISDTISKPPPITTTTTRTVLRNFPSLNTGQGVL